MTSRNRAAVLAVFIIAAPVSAVLAQATSPKITPSRSAALATGELRGRVLNAATHAPIRIATIDVNPLTGTATPRHASSDTGGTFRVEGLQPGRYRVRIRALGYAVRNVPSVLIAAGGPGTDLGSLGLTAVAAQIQRVVVSTQREQAMLAPDRNTYVMRDMPTTRGGNALDVLRNVPSVDVDIDNVVSLRGNSGVVVQINGRPSPLKPAQLGNFLAQLPAELVDKVEIIPNPSARDDPEGVAGIINIVLKQETDAGTGGGLTLAAGTTGRLDIGGNLGYQRGPLSLYGSYGFLRDDRPRTEAIYRKNLYTSPLTYLQEQGRRSQIPLAHTFTGSAGYKLGKDDELSADLMYSTRREIEVNSILYRYLDAANTLTDLADRTTRGTNHEYNFESTLAYKHSFPGKQHTLSTELRLFRAREGGPTAVTARNLALDGTPIGNSALELATGYDHPNENSVKVDYVRPLSSSLRLETGYKGSLQTFHTTLDTRVFDPAVSAYLPDTTRINDFTYDQTVNAAYGMLDAQAGSFVLQGGLRVERANTRFHLTAQNLNFDNNYSSLFPSGLVAYNVDDANQVKLSYSTRIQRPDDTDLIDPTLHYQDPLNVSRGNPYLRPEYIRSLELGFQRTTDRATIQVTPFFRHTLDAVRSLRTIDSSGVATRTFANIATSDSYGTDVTVALHGGRLSGFVGASGFRQVSNASNLDPSLSARTFGWTARTNASYRVSSTVDLQTFLFYRAAMTVEQGRNASRTRFSLAARKKLMGDKLNLTLRLIDPFNTSNERQTTIDPRFYQVSDRSRPSRGVLVALSWNFGNTPKDHQPADPTAADTGN